MGKIAFVFPGQGSQSVGMGRDFFTEPEGKAVYECFNTHVAANLSEICFNGPEETLRRTLYTQPAILATSIAALTLFQQKLSCQPDVVAGHSLGEYGALYAARVISLEAAAQLVKQRATLMEAASKGAMSAVLGLEASAVEEIVKQITETSNDILTVANYNTTNQLVISGTPTAVEAAGEPLKAAGAKRVLPLPVGGAFHSPLMADAAREFADKLQQVTFANAEVPVITNVDARATILAGDLREKLSRQIESSVRWEQTMTSMVNDLGVETVIEFGPGKVLTGMFKKQFPDVALYNVTDLSSLETVANELGESLSVKTPASV